MKKTFFFLILILTIISKSSAQNNLYSLEVQIIGLKSNKGKVLLRLSDNKNKLTNKKRGKINNKSCTLIFNN